MNFNAGNIIMLGIGAILIYSAVKNKSPKDVIVNAFSPNSATAPNPHASAPNGPRATPGAGSSAPNNTTESRSPITSN